MPKEVASLDFSQDISLADEMAADEMVARMVMDGHMDRLLGHSDG